MRYTLDKPQRLWPRKSLVGSAYGEVVAGLYVILVSATVYAGTLTPGKPRVESDRYEVPIYLSGAANDVAALDFSLAYDPAVFQPVSISPGAAASAAGKLVTANLPEPGKYIVVMMGFNQTPVANGEVARIVLERVGSAPQGETKLTVGDTTLSTWEGVELPAEGGSAALTVASKDEKPSGDNGTKPDAGKPEKPETPETPHIHGTPIRAGEPQSVKELYEWTKAMFAKFVPAEEAAIPPEPPVLPSAEDLDRAAEEEKLKQAPLPTDTIQ